MYGVMAETDVWITGLRRSQSVARANLRMIEWEWRYQALKISPLAKWERPEIVEYIKKHNVPYNVLHEQGYPTVGCTHCTKPVPGSTLGDYSRAGRWSDSEKTECGLHGGEGI
ncbi:MAG: phosphoadenosine phosphosulfate reductase family protein [Planctomycetes bacterium]|nr:phosphoadenosine phosphosulfate reductase family protein [Planctomycetota bacterium]